MTELTYIHTNHFYPCFVPYRYLVLHVLDKALVGDTEAMGQVYIELSNLDIDRGYSGSFPLADLVCYLSIYLMNCLGSVVAAF